MANYKATGLILKTRDFGESDRIVTILDPDLGKLEAVARGARRTRSRLGGPCQPFSHNQFLLWQGRSLDGIIQCEVLDSFAPLRDDLLKLAAASYITELVDEVVREKDPSPEVFDLTLGTFRWLAEVDAAPGPVTHVLRAFEVRLLTLVGLGPSLDSCATCGAPVESWADRSAGQAGALAFSAAAGGVVCPACRALWPSPGAPPGVVPLAPGTLRALRYLAGADLDKARVLRLTPGAAREMERALREHIVYHLDRRPRTLDFLDSVLGGCVDTPYHVC